MEYSKRSAETKQQNDIESCVYIPQYTPQPDQMH